MSLILPIYVTGFSDIYSQFFNAIASTIGSASYGSFLKLGILLGGFWTLLFSSLKKDIGLNFKWLIGYVIIMTVVLTPTVTVEIIDDTNLVKAQTVAHIPLGLGMIASFTSRVGYGLTQLVEKTFHTPNEFDYTHSGILFGSQLILSSLQFQVVDDDFNRDLQSFINQCVFYDLLLHKYSMQELINTSDIWQLVTKNPSPARAFIYKSKVTTCADGSRALENDWKKALDYSADSYAHLLYPSAHNTQNAKAQLLSNLPTTYQYFTNLSEESANGVLQQSMMFQAITDGMQNWSAKINSSGGLASASFAKAQEQKRQGYTMLYRMAIYWLPLLKVNLELIVYGTFPIIVFLAFFPGGFAAAQYYLFTMVWLQFWAPLFAFVNFIFNLALQHSASTATLFGSTHTLSLHTFSALDEMTRDLGSLAGFVISMVPFLSVGIFKGMMNVFTQISQSVTGAIQSLSLSAAGETVTGNLSMGNTQFSNHSAHNTNANVFDTNARVSSGVLSYQLSGGSTATVTPGGEMILNTQGGISNVPVQIQMAESLRTSVSTMADQAWSAGLRNAHSASESYNAGIRELYDFGTSKSHTDSSGSSSSVSTSGSFSSAAREVHQLVDRFAHDNNISISEASRALGSVYQDAHVTGHFNLKDQLGGKVANWISGFNASASASVGVRHENSHSSDTQNSELYNKATSFSKEHNFNQAVDYSLRAAQENNYRSGSDISHREAQSFSSHFEKGNRYANDAVNSFDQSESYRKQASQISENSQSINVQASQEFVNWMTHQSAPGGHRKMDGATLEQIMKNEPDLKSQYAEQFIREHKENYLQNFNHKYTRSAINAAYEANNFSLSGVEDVNHAHKFNDEKIMNKSDKHIGEIDKKITDETHNLIDESKQRSGKSIETEGNKIIKDIQDARSKHHD